MSKGQETVLCRSRDGTALGDISQQLGRGFIASHHKGFLTRGKRSRGSGCPSTLAFLRVNLRISLLAFWSQPYPPTSFTGLVASR